MPRAALFALLLAFGCFAAPGLAAAEDHDDEPLPADVRSLVEQVSVVIDRLERDRDPEVEDRGVVRIARPVVQLMGPGVETSRSLRGDRNLRVTVRPGARGAWVRAGVRW